MGDVEQVEKMMQAYWAQEGNNDQARDIFKTFIRASKLGTCIRAIAYWILAYPRRLWTYRDYMPMLLGTILHEHLLQPSSEKAGTGIRNMEQEIEKTWNVPVEWKGKTYKVPVTVRGHQDGERTYGSHTRLQEFKTMGDWRFKSFMSATPKELRIDFKRELIQAATYCDIKGHKVAEIYSMNRSNGKFERLREKPDKRMLHRRLREVGKVLLVLGKTDGKLLPKRPYTPSHALCKLCDYKEHCWGELAQSFRQ